MYGFCIVYQPVMVLMSKYSPGRLAVLCICFLWIEMLTYGGRRWLRRIRLISPRKLWNFKDPQGLWPTLYKQETSLGKRSLQRRWSTFQCALGNVALWVISNASWGVLFCDAIALVILDPASEPSPSPILLYRTSVNSMIQQTRLGWNSFLGLSPMQYLEWLDIYSQHASFHYMRSSETSSSFCVGSLPMD